MEKTFRNLRDAYKHYRKGKKRFEGVKRDNYLWMTSNYSRFIASKVLAGHTFILPYRLGTLSIIGKKLKPYFDDNGIALPVELLSFKYKDGMFIWESASEVNVSHYNLELSPSFDYKVINRTEANNAPSVYTFEKKNIVGTIYARLNMIDFDGSSEYSPTIVIKGEKTDDFIAYPNPASNFLFVSENTEARHYITGQRIILSEGLNTLNGVTPGYYLINEQLIYVQ